MIKFLDLHAQYTSIRGEIDAAIADVIRRSAFVGGDDIHLFEEEFAAYQQSGWCVGVGNGTDAIEIVLEALDLPAGAEVIVPANSFIASSEAVTRSGFRVVFADVDPHTYTLSVDDLRRRITGKTAAIIAVHLYGHPCAMRELEKTTRDQGIIVIEDCAQAHGAQYEGKRVGAIARAGTFSFYPGKNLGAYGDGGAITTNDKALALRCRMIANHGRVDKYDHQLEGRNSRLDGLQAAILRVKLRHLDNWIAQRNEVARIYQAGLASVGDIVVPTVAPGCGHSFHLFVIRTSERDRLSTHLGSRGIQTGIHYPIALPKLKAYEYLGAVQPMFACSADSTLLSLPIGEHISTEAATHIVQAIREHFD